MEKGRPSAYRTRLLRTGTDQKPSGLKKYIIPEQGVELAKSWRTGRVIGCLYGAAVFTHRGENLVRVILSAPWVLIFFLITLL